MSNLTAIGSTSRRTFLRNGVLATGTLALGVPALSGRAAAAKSGRRPGTVPVFPSDIDGDDAVFYRVFQAGAAADEFVKGPDKAPFDRIIVTAAPPHIPRALVDQLKTGGRMVLPVGDRIQALKVVEKKPDGTVEQVELMKVRFVPMVHGKDAG